MGDLLKVLVIDDEEVVLDSCGRILDKGQYEIATASNGEAGLGKIAEYHPDIVFVDLKMPGMSGLEVIERIRAIDPTIVIVVITGYSTVDSAVESMKRGAYDFLPKPFHPEEFRLIARRGGEKRCLVLETAALRREKELLRENFAAIVSHELKSPLAALQQSLYAMTSGPLPEEVLTRLKRMQFRVDDLMKIIHTWLRAMSSDIGGIRENFGTVSVEAVVSKAADSVRPEAVRKGIEVAVEVAKGADSVRGDEGTLVEALVNIAGNAVKYSRMQGKVAVRASREGDHVRIAVSDQGVGMTPEDVRMVFGGFGRGSAGTAAEEGHGFGLAISRRIVEAHGGTVTVESEPGRGSTFVVSLPAWKE